MTRITFCAVIPLQEALAAGFAAAEKEHFFEAQRDQYMARRDLLLGFLNQLGLPYTAVCSYFVLVETSKVKIPPEFEILELIKSRSRDWHMCWFIAKVLDEISPKCYMSGTRACADPENSLFPSVSDRNHRPFSRSQQAKPRITKLKLQRKCPKNKLSC
ncbi:hypothetical protein PTTG_08308 [Puccinia triticina 1-1 BBBD Race 1]|uniref:Uncharacterized protein n=1 Tax=Puccinia triticina (isolate 1-1 / race 1 (BBBD)) TaxID=630390 RepID=A0A180GD58_PUCT1|nr:hypothetical protein PTTG_08308 [Puccinia triticina 1-1 BBBD Race 1]